MVFVLYKKKSFIQTNLIVLKTFQFKYLQVLNIFFIIEKVLRNCKQILRLF